MSWLWLLLAPIGLAAAEAPRISYSKSFPGSVPAYVAITVDRDGRGEYREAPDDASPVTFRLAGKETEEIFALVDKLARFTRPLESNLKVANTGIKTFRYQSDAEDHAVQFNYSLDPDARLLWDWFERVAETEQHFIALGRAARYDRLGVNQALLRLETSRDRNRLVATEQFLKLLDRIANNESYLHMARERAAKLAESFRAAAAGNQQQ